MLESGAITGHHERERFFFFFSWGLPENVSGSLRVFLNTYWALVSDQVTLAYCVYALDKVEEEVCVSDWLVVALLQKKAEGFTFLLNFTSLS